MVWSLGLKNTLNPKQSKGGKRGGSIKENPTVCVFSPAGNRSFPTLLKNLCLFNSWRNHTVQHETRFWLKILYILLKVHTASAKAKCLYRKTEMTFNDKYFECDFFFIYHFKYFNSRKSWGPSVAFSSTRKAVVSPVMPAVTQMLDQHESWSRLLCGIITGRNEAVSSRYFGMK